MDFALRSIALVLFWVQLSYGSLLWSEEFSTYNSMKDNFYINVVPQSHNDELQYYTDRRDNVDVRDGHLVLTPIKEYYGDKQYTSGRIQSYYAWKFGRVEVRAKLPNGYGLWPAIWMMPRDYVYGGWPTSGEIDIIEARGENLHEVQSTIHYASYHDMKTSGMVQLSCSINQFHVYEMVWTETDMIFYMDGQEYYRIDMDQYFSWDYDHKEAPFDQYFYLILNVAVGGNYVNDPNWNTVWTSDDEMLVDYVRVYSDTDVSGGGGGIGGGGNTGGGGSSDCPCQAKESASYDDMCNADDWACYNQNYANVDSACTDRLSYCCGGVTHRCDVEEVRDLTSAVFTAYDDQLSSDTSCDFSGCAEHRCDDSGGIIGGGGGIIGGGGSDGGSSSSGPKCLISDSASRDDVCGALQWACYENYYNDVSSECADAQHALDCCNNAPLAVCTDKQLRADADVVFQAYYDADPQASSCDFGGVCYLSYSRAASARIYATCYDGYGG